MDILSVNPIQKFQQWWRVALEIDESGFPNGRFVDLKSVDENGFTFCTYLDSAKGMQIQINPKTAMTVWWDHVVT